MSGSWKTNTDVQRGWKCLATAISFLLFLSLNGEIGQFEKYMTVIGIEMWREFKIVNRSKNTAVRASANVSYEAEKWQTAFFGPLNWKNLQ